MFRLQFLGATKTVTGSKFYLTDGRVNILIDCGLYQGLRELRRRNWEKLPVNPADIDYCILTHAHIDHTGYIPKFTKEGFKGQIWATKPTVDLCQILLLDSAHLQEEYAAYANKKGFSKYEVAMPLYTVRDAEESLKYFVPRNYNQVYKISDNIQVKFLDAGHLLGSAILEIILRYDGKVRRIIFSGDLGHYQVPILKNPSPVYKADYLVLESTYGNRLHSSESNEFELEKVINDTFSAGGVLLIPAFSVGRTQAILYYIKRLQDTGRISKKTNVYIDSPMAINATKIFLKYKNYHDIETQKLEDKGQSPILCHNLHYVRKHEESKKLNKLGAGNIIISADGMCTGGRILHHLVHRISDPKNTILFSGYQAEGTRGRRILEGEKNIKIFGRIFPVEAKIKVINGFSAHADYEEILYWLFNLESDPSKVFLVHGEEKAIESLKEKIEKKYKWEVNIPEYRDTVVLN
ncbi:MAG: MBL fold metallo-hydrolase [Armatimonadota bacterium]